MKINNKKVLKVFLTVSLLSALIITLFLLFKTDTYLIEINLNKDLNEYALSEFAYMGAGGISNVGFFKSSMSLSIVYSYDYERQKDFYYTIKIGKDNCNELRGGGRTSDYWYENNFKNGAIIKKLLKNKDNVYFCILKDYGKESEKENCFKMNFKKV